MVEHEKSFITSWPDLVKVHRCGECFLTLASSLGISNESIQNLIGLLLGVQVYKVCTDTFVRI